MRPEILSALYQHTLVFMPEDEFRRSLDGWEATSVEKDGKPLFIALQRGPEFHLASMGTGESLPRREIRSYLRKIIAAHGFAQTRTPKEPKAIWDRQHRFNRILGFTVVAEDNDFVIYKIEKVH